MATSDSVPVRVRHEHAVTTQTDPSEEYIHRLEHHTLVPVDAGVIPDRCHVVQLDWTTRRRQPIFLPYANLNPR